METIVTETARLAKKQRTWLKRETDRPDSHYFYLRRPEQWNELPEQALRLLQQFLGRGLKEQEEKRWL
jgi:tRNA A37 N6-isopentenylltransferase MiaA